MHTRSKGLPLSFFLWIFLLALGAAVVVARSKQGMDVYVLDVGQGDASLIQTESSMQMLIDGGPSSRVTEEIDQVMPLFDRTIELVMLTHPDSDHANGIQSVLEAYRVRALILTGVVRDSGALRGILEKAEAEKIPVYLAEEGMRIEIGGVLVRVLSPEQALFGRKLERTNNTGIVTEIVYGEHTLLFPADIDTMVEDRLIERGMLGDVTFLKVAHHGSKNASQETFLRVTQPDVAVISVGRDNRYGHPASEVMRRLESFRARVLRTDTEGRIHFHSDGKTYTIRTERET